MGVTHKREGEKGLFVVGENFVALGEKNQCDKLCKLVQKRADADLAVVVQPATALLACHRVRLGKASPPPSATDSETVSVTRHTHTKIM